MDGAAVAEQLTTGERRGCDSSVSFAFASAEHDAGLRRLLRESPMPGAISLSMEREPSFFAAAGIEGPWHQTIVGLRGGEVVCAGTISARQRFVNGSPVRIGYLSGLRIDPSFHGNVSVIRRGYEFFRREVHENGGPPIYLTSIIADNVRARRLLERGIKGMPTYRYLGDFITIAIASRRPKRSLKRCHLGSSATSMAEIMNRVNQEHQQYQFAPLIGDADLHLPGLEPNHFICATRGGPCAAIWDQRAVKQTVIRGYSGVLRHCRPWINALASLKRRPKLPAAGQPLAHAYVAYLAGAEGEDDLLPELIETCRSAACQREIDFIVLGFDARDPRLARLRKAFRCLSYASRIYAVHWPDGADLAHQLDNRLLAPEAALL